ncbi:tetratricopeptide repeat protein [Thioalkalicoccus limnaeus]|uniref:Tetratricopeptide repeat protein n=1 Tax=Thioalkalicoccus limnaeus TaxID=120681 RepID=A0ABV4BCI6_9GAMM
MPRPIILLFLCALVSPLTAHAGAPQALALAEQAVHRAEQTANQDPQGLVARVNDLAMEYLIQGELLQAERQYQRALAFQEQVTGSEDPRVANTLDNLAWVQVKEAHYDQAESLFRQSLAIRERTLGPDHPLVARSLTNLAALYLYWDRAEEVPPLTKRAVTIWSGDRHGGDSNPSQR